MLLTFFIEIDASIQNLRWDPSSKSIQFLCNLAAKPMIKQTDIGEIIIFLVEEKYLAYSC